MKPQRYTRTRPGPRHRDGVKIPAGLDGIREAAEWIRSVPGHEVPFVSRDGLLIRHESDIYGACYQWVEVGEVVAFDNDDETLADYGSMTLAEVQS